jgi:mannose-6-phosphate isomerase-like protein (cupin superfamily)
MQLNLMNVRVIALVAQARERWPLAGDQLYLDLDLSADNLPPGTRLALGAAIIEVTAQPHTGCLKFRARFGPDALQFINSPVGKLLRLRGLNAKVVQPGVIRVGDVARKLQGLRPSRRVEEKPMSSASQPVLRKPGEGRTIAIVGDVYRFLATGEETNGKYALWEAFVTPGGGPPLHVHSREEEGFYILDGAITFQIGDQRVVAGPGVFVNMPVGTPHTFKNESGQPARMLISIAPAGLEQMFFEIGQPVPPGARTAPPPTREAIEKLLAVAPRYGIEIKLPQS